MFDQKLSFATLVDAVQRGREHQVGTRKKQAEQDLVGKGGAPDMASAQTNTQPRCVGGDQTQTAPARRKRFGTQQLHVADEDGAKS